MTDNMIRGKTVVIAGAGVAGLTAGLRLAEAGARVVVAEKEKSVGGLARSFRYGDFIFDVGPHRFHTDDAEVLSFIEGSLGGRYVVMPRRSGVWLFGRYHDWPLDISTLFKLPPGVLLGVLGDLFARRPPEGASFRDYILARYGRTLYECFFSEYTRKFLKHDPAAIHSDWAKAGIDRAVIDRRLRMDTLFEVAKRALLPSPVKTEFIYPAEGGIDSFSRALAAGVAARGGEVLTGSPVERLETGEGRVGAVVLRGGRRISPDRLIWTAPLDALCACAGAGPTGLAYLSAILYNVEVRGIPPVRYQWCYYGQKNILFNRISIPRYFRESTCPPDAVGLGAEVTCMKGDGLWEDPERASEQVAADMRAVGLLGGGSRMERVHVERIENVYPIYELDYHRTLRETLGRFAGLTNLVLAGRTGTFWYNNMDHSVRAGLECAGDLISGAGRRRLYTRRDYVFDG